jgi:primosomal protein N' (replication factor Y)
MTDREKTAVWQGVSQGNFKVVVGPRSALFAPLPNLGLIIVDEEHDGSYKQDNPAPRFHGRDSAVMRARINNIPVLLGSASPSFESYYNAKSGRYKLLTLTKRPAGARLPTVKLIDMRRERLGGDLFYFSYALKSEAEKRIELGQQVILYLNRRGYSPQLKCLSCGQVPQCEHCQVSLTYHRAGRRLTCHYCGYTIKAAEVCPHCASDQILYSGVGTQKVEQMLPRLIEKAVVTRMDSDSASGRRRAHNILVDFAAEKSNVLLGTQMVTKGLDIPGVTLVGVLAADAALNMPDFRAAEKVFARLLQVSGRSGRSEHQGEVLFQTYDPENPILTEAASGSYQSFFEREIESRKALEYPPFTHLINFTLSGGDQSQLKSKAELLCDKLKEKIKTTSLDCPVLGSNSCPIELLRGKYRRHFFVKTKRVVNFVRMLTEWEEQEPGFGLPSGMRITIDVDPDDMM